MRLFQVRKGMIVRLRSGGPRMTVRQINKEHSMVVVTWFSQSNQFESVCLDPACLDSMETILDTIFNSLFPIPLHGGGYTPTHAGDKSRPPQRSALAN